jgi:hypothetical protein
VPRAAPPALGAAARDGHLFDLRVMNNGDRRRFRMVLGARKRRWWAGKIPLAGQFAEGYSFCAAAPAAAFEHGARLRWQAVGHAHPTPGPQPIPTPPPIPTIFAPL